MSGVQTKLCPRGPNKHHLRLNPDHLNSLKHPHLSIFFWLDLIHPYPSWTLENTVRIDSNIKQTNTNSLHQYQSHNEPNIALILFHITVQNWKYRNSETRFRESRQAVAKIAIPTPHTILGVNCSIICIVLGNFITPNITIPKIIRL